jgi:hypothetical protein
MGIKDYHKWMKDNNPTAFQQKWLDFYDHIYFDINFALHYSHYGTKNQNQILFRFFSFIERIILLLHPTKSIVIANDGAAPIAKLLLQRQRRISTARDGVDEDSEEFSDKNLEASSLIFTPGTEFMNTIEEKLEKFMSKIKVVYNVNVEYMIGCEGEAELKLKKRMMDKNKENPDDTHIIISNDADIIAMFGTFDVNSYSKIFICSNVKNIEIISMGKLMDSHTNKYGITKSFGLDFTLISILVGNDYLPKINLVDLTKLWNSYKKWHNDYKNGLVNDFIINIPFLIQILNGIISCTRPHLTQKFEIDDYNHPLYSNYMEGVLWCLDMYNKGYCDRYNYMYQNNDSPHPFGLILNLNGSPNIASFKNITYPTIDSNLYALLVLPRKALKLTHDKYHTFAKKYHILYDEELCEICCEFYKKMKNLDKKGTEYKQLFKELKNHKNNNHNPITSDDIEEIVKDYITEFSEN